MHSPPERLEDRVAAITEALNTASFGTASEVEAELKGLRQRADAVCQDLSQAPLERAQACVPALETLLSQLDRLARDTEKRRDQLAARLARLTPPDPDLVR